jgi:hypothetical protein
MTAPPDPHEADARFAPVLRGEIASIRPDVALPPEGATLEQVHAAIDGAATPLSALCLSGGGHFENLGLYEMVRRRCRFIVVSDAGRDPDAALADLGNAVRKVSIDFGARVRFDSLEVAPVARPAKPASFAWVGQIWYPCSDTPGWLLYLRPTYQGDETADIRGYAEANPSFPQESTSEQWFGESQFEAYRALGARQMELLCGGGVDRSRDPPPHLADLDALRDKAEKYLAREAAAPATRARP